MVTNFFRRFILLGVLGFLSAEANCQFPVDSVNEIESNVIPYFLPDPLISENGTRINSKEEWINSQRPFLFRQFEDNVYGKFPEINVEAHYKLLETGDAFGGKAIRKQIRIYWINENRDFIDVLIYLPRINIYRKAQPKPIFLGLNFGGNASVSTDKAILLSKGLNEDIRGKNSSRWPIEEIINNGIGVATAWYYDIEKDSPDGWESGLRNYLKDYLNQSPKDWGAIGAWAWGLTQIMNYIQSDKDIDGERVAVMGLSRLGKTALWAGAADQRFSVVISNESGEGGAALARRWFGETVGIINKSFPHWFNAKYKSYSNDVFKLPVDQHELLALVAPRPLYVASAEGDLWSDPKGEFLSVWYAGVVYDLFNEKGIESGLMPLTNTPIGSDVVGYHIRDGMHDITLYDWTQYLRFVKKVWKLGN